MKKLPTIKLPIATGLFLFLFCLLVATAIVSGSTRLLAPGDLDPSFGAGGIVMTHVTDLNDQTNSVKIQPDGKIVVGGYVSYSGSAGADFIVARYNVDGSLDTTFDSDGVAIISVDVYDGAKALTLQPDGKIVLVGNYFGPNSSTWALELVRLNTDGSLDNSFDGDGKVTTLIGQFFSVTSIAVQSDGRILAAGGIGDGVDYNTFVYRYNSDGTLDPSFDGDGKVLIEVSSLDDEATGIAVQADGKIVLGGYATILRSPNVFDDDFEAVRLTTAGSLDNTFGSNGIATTPIGPDLDRANGMALQSDGKILVTGFSRDQAFNWDFATIRYTANGLLDDSFGSLGKVLTPMGGNRDEASSVQVQSNDKIVVCGGASNGSNGDFGVVRYNHDGTLDTSFSGDGRIIAPIGTDTDIATDISIQPDGNIVVAGITRVGTNDDFALVRFVGDNAVMRHASFDYDSDGKSDISVFRPSSGAWYLQRSRDGLYGAEFGYATDRIAPADYDGDGKTDIAVYRPETGIWYVFQSSTGTVNYTVFGLPEDLPTTADYDGDGRADVSVFRPSAATWYRQNSSDGSFYAIQFGASEDKPTIGDFDGDGHSDVAIFRPSVGAWYELYSSDNSLHGRQFGFGTDVITPADYDGDGKTDIAVFRPSDGLWYIANSSDGSITYAVFGLADDIPSPGDFDGDGKADISVFRPSDGTWYRTNSSDGSFYAYPFGTNGDKPTQTAFRY